MAAQKKIRAGFTENEEMVVFPGDCLELLKQVPDRSLQLIVTSPPYNIGKEYEFSIDGRSMLSLWQVTREQISCNS